MTGVQTCALPISKDGGDLPRTGFETFNIVAAALALIVAGGTAVTIVRRRKLSIQ